MVTSQRARRAVLGGLLLLAWLAFAVPAAGQAPGCRRELGGQAGAEVAVQLLGADSSGAPTPVGAPATELEARSGQVLRLLARPLEGPARPSGAECPVRVNVGRLMAVGRLLTRGGFVFDSGNAYGLLAPGEARALDFEVRPFEEWDATPEKIEVENVTIRLPEVAEFVAHLPAPFRPPAGTICADVVYPNAEPAGGVVLGLSAPPDGPTDRRPSGPEGGVCWEGVDPSIYADLSLEEPAEAALGLPESRYVSHEASYRLFVVKRPR
jgi:hypothetical protein